jgi:hypothetical protein
MKVIFRIFTNCIVAGIFSHAQDLDVTVCDLLE